jgi:ABC-type multidrug transport system ATPase subunit
MDQLKLEAKELTVDFGQGFLFQNLCWEAVGGDFWAVEGDNGAGKSTFLKILAGVTKPAGGDVLLNGKNLNNIPIHQRKKHLGYMPSKRMLSGWIDVETAVQVGANQVNDHTLNSALTDFHLSSKRNQLVHSLSDGEYIRMQLVRLLLQDPEVILLDEPAAMLDSTWRKKIYEYLAEWARRGKIVVICSHELELNKLYCNQILHL